MATAVAAAAAAAHPLERGRDLPNIYLVATVF